MNQPLNQSEIIRSNIASLQTAILEKHPTMPVLLREIFRQLKDDPATVTLLSEEEISTVVRGLENQTNTYLAASMTKAKPGSAAVKALSKVKSSDLGFD